MPTFLRRLLLINASALLLGSLPAPLAAQPNYTTPYSVTTLAGISSDGSDDGMGSTARFNGPGCITLDANGNLYVADVGNHTIRKITSTGTVSTIAGLANVSGDADGPGNLARFSSPRGIARDAVGNLYVTDGENHTVRKITPTGLVTTVAGLAGKRGSQDGLGTEARFDFPAQIAVDAGGTLYVTDTLNSTIRKISAAGIVTTLAGTPGVTGHSDGIGSAVKFSNPFGLALDATGNLYIVDTFNDAIRKITPNGNVTTIASGGDLYRPFGITVGTAGVLYVANSYGSIVQQISPAGVVTLFAGTSGSNGSQDGPAASAQFLFPIALTADAASAIYVADTGNNTIRKIANGVVTTLAGLSPAAAYGSTDGTGSAARFSWAEGIALAANGDIYVADTYNHTVRKVTPAGVVTTLAGRAGLAGLNDGPGSSATFNYPSGLAVDAAGNVYVADMFNDRIRKISPAGIVSTVAPGFDSPGGVAVDASGNLYVADTENHVIRKITPTGTVSTLAGSPGVNGSADGQGSAARFNSPNALAVDAAGNVFVADTVNRTIRKITSAGLVSTVAGSVGAKGDADGTGTAARFRDPVGIAVDGGGNLYVTDQDSDTVRKITPAGVVSTVAGDPDDFGGTDGVGRKALFLFPYAIAADAAGNLVITSDTTIRKAMPAVAPGFTTQPQSQSVTVGGTVTFTALATGTPSPTYQWYVNNAAIAGATASTLTLSNVQSTHAGTYTVVATNGAAALTSAAATLTVTTPAPVPTPTPTPAPTPVPSSGGGGGGAPSSWFWSALVVALLARRASRHSQ